ncbi:MAG: matrixin family metalloprotease, partial [Pirellulales bacterium]
MSADRAGNRRVCSPWIGPLIGWLTLALGAGSSGAEVVLIENRTSEDLAFRLSGAEGRSLDGRSVSGRLLPVAVTGRIAVAFRAGNKLRRFALEPNRAYAFVPSAEGARLAAIPLEPDPRKRRAAVSDGKLLGGLRPRTVTVKLLVDDDEPSVRRLWEPKLRRRIAAASAVFQRHCNVTLKVVEVATWNSDDQAVDFAESLREFERGVDPGKAMVAVGFTSQYPLPTGKTHLGGTRGPLHPWVLVREWSQHVTASERLEVLVHELGHYLGAAHSPERTSVMRPTMGDRLSHAKNFVIRFDALNALAMCLVARQRDDYRDRRRLGLRMDPAAASAMRRIYATLDKRMPMDPAAGQLLAMFGGPKPEKPFRWDLLVDPPDAPPGRPPARSERPGFYERGGMRVGRPEGRLPAGVG